MSGQYLCNMPKPKRPRDVNQRAKSIVEIATGEKEDTTSVEDTRDPAAVSLGRKGGKARAKNLSPEKRSDIAKQAAKKRWSDKAQGS